MNYGYGDGALDPLLRISGRYRVLKHHESIELARKAQQYRSLESRRVPLESDAEAAARLNIPVSELTDIIAAGKRAEDSLVLHNLRLVVALAKKIRTKIPIEDLVQYGIIGLVEAVRLFDPTLGYTFSTYAYYRIRQQFYHAVRSVDRLIRLPSHIYDKRVSILKALEARSKEIGRSADLKDLVSGVKLKYRGPLTLSEMVSVLELYGRTPQSLEGMVSTEYGDEFAFDPIDPDSAPSTESIEREHLKATLNEAIEALPTQEQRDSIRQHYGLNGPAVTLEALAKKRGVSMPKLKSELNTARYRIKMYLKYRSVTLDDLVSAA